MKEAEKTSEFLKTKSAEIDLLSQIKAMDAQQLDEQEEDQIKNLGQTSMAFDAESEDEYTPLALVSRRRSTTAALAGDGGLVYMEYDTGRVG